MMEGTRRALGLALGFVLLLAGPGAAQTSGSSSASVDPATAQAGDDLLLIFNITSPEVAEIRIGEEIRCTVTFPSGQEQFPCRANESLVQVRAAGEDTRSYLFPYQAPDEVGAYQVDFNATTDLSVPSTSYEAETSFDVVPADEPLSATEDGAPGNGTADDDGAGEETPQTDEGADDSAGPADDGDDTDESPSEANAGPAPRDESRIFVSTTASVTVLAAGLVATRWPIGG